MHKARCCPAVSDPVLSTVTSCVVHAARHGMYRVESSEYRPEGKVDHRQLSGAARHSDQSIQWIEFSWHIHSHQLSGGARHGDQGIRCPESNWHIHNRQLCCSETRRPMSSVSRIYYGTSTATSSVVRDTATNKFSVQNPVGTSTTTSTVVQRDTATNKFSVQNPIGTSTATRCVAAKHCDQRVQCLESNWHINNDQRSGAARHGDQ